MMSLSTKLRRSLSSLPAFQRELLIVFAFTALTLVMTWPWAAHLRSAASDPGDPYLISWTLWWDYHQTFKDPLHLFQANIFYPYRYSLAFSEHCYGIALLFFPLFALGARPLTVQSIAIILGFILSGYGMFRLARTLTGSNGVAWVAGLGFAFIPYRFAQLPHLMYMFAGWIPLLFEALILFARVRSWPRATWLGVAFLMNALTSIHWFVLTLIPIALAAAFLLTRYRVWGKTAFWVRSFVSLGLASLLLLPFLIPYARAAKLYGFIRSADEVAFYSASPSHWLVSPAQNKLWSGFGRHLVENPDERELFPGLLLLLLALAAMLLVGRRAQFVHETEVREVTTRQRIILVCLDVLAVALALDVLYVTGAGSFKLRLLGMTLFRDSSASRTVWYLFAVVLARFCVAYPRFLRQRGASNLIDTLRSDRREEGFWLGLLWCALGFLGSLGSNFRFHRVLYEWVPLFRSIRVPPRWAMIAYVGLALLAGIGARRIAETCTREKSRVRQPAIIYTLIAVALLFELRAAPLGLTRGEVGPDELSLRLKTIPMRGGLVGLPYGEGLVSHYQDLRAADHGRPLITAFSGFSPPIPHEIEELSQSRPIPIRLLEVMESVPTSYVVVYNAFLPATRRPGIQSFICDALSEGRLRYIRSYGEGDRRQDLFAVTKIEPEARSEAPLPPDLEPREFSSSVNDLNFVVGEFDGWAFRQYSLYKVGFGRLPRYEEFLSDAQQTGRGLIFCKSDWQQQLDENLRALDKRLTTRAEFNRINNGEGDAIYVQRLYEHAGLKPDAAETTALDRALNDGSETRASVLWRVAASETFKRQEGDAAFVLMQYFAYLHRNPDDPPDHNLDGFNFWLAELRKNGREQVTKAFITSDEHAAVLNRK